MYTFQVSSSSVTTRINGNCEAFSNSTGVQCLFDLNSFKNHKAILTFSFVDKCQTTTNFTKGISISSLKEITNSIGIEMCCMGPNLMVTDATEAKALELTRYLSIN